MPLRIEQKPLGILAIFRQENDSGFRQELTSATVCVSAISPLDSPSIHESMLYGIAVYHPLPGKHDLPPDYALSREELASMPIENIPLTIEHLGIREAVSSLMSKNTELTPQRVGEELDKMGAEKTPVGIVVGNSEGADKRWYAIFAVDDVSFPIVPFLIKSGALRGVSLTHRVGSEPLALELSLCVRPARPECYVLRLGHNLSEQLHYLRTAIIQSSMSETTPLQRVMESLPEEDRKLVTARFADLMSAIDGAKSDLAEVKEENERMKKDASIANASINNSILRNQIKMMSDQLDPEIREAFYCDGDSLMEELTSDHSETVLRAADRMICACNKQMMQMRANNLPLRPSPPKRKAETLEEPVVEQSADPITRALAETFTV